MTRGQIFAAQLELWLGTPFQWQGRTRGLRADCKGLHAGAAAELGWPEAESLHALAADYGDPVDSRRLKAGMADLFDPVSERQTGDLLLINVRGAACHIACAHPKDRAPTRTIEALHVGPKQVCWFRRAEAEIDSIWRWRELD